MWAGSFFFAQDFFLRSPKKSFLVSARQDTAKPIPGIFYGISPPLTLAHHFSETQHLFCPAEEAPSRALFFTEGGTWFPVF